MNNLCPFFKENCKGNECVMWKDEGCLVVAFMEKLVIPSAEEFEDVYKRDSLDIVHFERPEKPEVPAEFKSLTPEELALELISFAKKELGDEDRIYIRQVSHLYWNTKGVNRYLIPAEFQLKLDKAERLAQKELDNEREQKEKQRLEEEKTELPSLVASCVDWAKEHGLKRITQSDVDAFLLEKNIQIMKQTQRALYSMANVAIKSKEH